MATKTSTADKYFATQQRDQTVKDMVEKERAATAAKSARLKALRLAKEAEDREAMAKLLPEPAKPRRRTKVKTGA